MRTGEPRTNNGARTTRWAWLGASLLAASLMVLATGCLTTDAHITISDDGSGELRMEVFPPQEVAGAIEASGVEALARDALEGVDGATFEAQERIGQTFYIVKVPFEDFRQLTTNIADGATIAGQNLTPFSQFDLRELPDGGWSLNAVTNPLEQAATFSQGSPLAGLKGLAANEEAGAGMELSVTLPGRLTDSNADVEEGETARWNLDDPAATYDLQMRTEATPLLTPLQWVLIGVLAVFLIGGILMFVGASGPVKRRTLRKPSRKEHEAFLPNQGAAEPKQPKTRKQRAHRRKRVVTGDATGWENPGAATGPGPQTPVDPSTGETASRPPATLPPLDPESPPPVPEEPSSGEALRPPTVLPPGPELGSDESTEDA